MLDWKREAADELRNYTNRKAAIENIRDQIADLATEITSIRSASADGSPVAGGSNGRDDALVNNILKRITAACIIADFRLFRLRRMGGRKWAKCCLMKLSP